MTNGDRRGAAERRLPGRAAGVSLAALGLLVITWPFLRTPPLGLLPAYLHLLGAWTVLIGAIAWLSAWVARNDERDE